MNELALFAGAGGGILGGYLLGWRTVCAVEWADYPRKVLLARQRDGILPRFPIWDDVQTFDGKPWRGRVDVVSGGFPCQDISSAGKGAGINGERSGMWTHMARIIGEVEPEWVLVENSPLLTSRGLDAVLRDLAQMGYDAEWGVLGARDIGLLHLRERIWIVAHSKSVKSRKSPERERWSDSFRGSSDCGRAEIARRIQSDWNTVESSLGRVADGVADKLDRLKAIGNGQVSGVAAFAFHSLSSFF